jgi:uncharacterized protein YabN with tetrapyrrole methylase and pyrophosphatase domain
MKMNKLIEKVVQWHYDRNLIEGSTDKAQMGKLYEEVKELNESVYYNKSPVDDIGDIMVVLINIAERNGLTLEQCLEHAYNDIQHRKGKMVNGVFVKEE